ncbi:MAG: hypothetical protein LBJ00_05375 [Planctomycetaceae bacterium]|nr:hypothetical protein [Planctomycetaceae bacterium]
MNNRFTLLRLPNALRCRFTVASGIVTIRSFDFYFFILPRNTRNLREKTRN